jgi:two-component system CheB/CheR fusion protein
MAAIESVPDERVGVVGIGASAGGVEALREFFGSLPPDLGLAYVVIVHLAPDHKSELGAIIARRTTMKVVEVRDEQPLPITGDTVFVIAPDRKLLIDDSTTRRSPQRRSKTHASAAPRSTCSSARWPRATVTASR